MLICMKKCCFRSVISSTMGTFTVGPLACFAGIILFAYYYNLGCDPLKSGQIGNPNQVSLLQTSLYVNTTWVLSCKTLYFMTLFSNSWLFDLITLG